MCDMTAALCVRWSTAPVWAAAVMCATGCSWQLVPLLLFAACLSSFHGRLTPGRLLAVLQEGPVVGCTC